MDEISMGEILKWKGRLPTLLAEVGGWDDSMRRVMSNGLLIAFSKAITLLEERFSTRPAIPGRDGPWKDWTAEQWANAEFCAVCGLPLLEVEDIPGQGKHVCAFCTWIEDTQLLIKSHDQRAELAEKALRNFLKLQRSVVKVQSDWVEGREQGMKDRVAGKVESENPFHFNLRRERNKAEGWVRGWTEMDHLQRMTEAEELIVGIYEDCPYEIDQASIPKGGIEKKPQQVVGVLSMGLLRYRQIRELARRAKPESATS